MIVHKTSFTHDASTHRRLYTEQFLQGEAFACGNFYIETLAHRRLYAQYLLYRCTVYAEVFTETCYYTHTDAFTRLFAQRIFNTQTPGLHKAGFTKRTSYAQMLLHSETVVRRGFYTKKLTHRTKMPAYWAYCKRFSNSCSSLTATGTRQPPYF